MIVEIFQGHAPDLPDADVTVVIDVLRAFTTSQVAFSRGIEEIWLAETVDEAFALKEQHPSFLLAGERNARKIEGFDFGNSPAALRDADADLEGRTMILTTSNGTRATLHALEHGATLVGGWTSAPATLGWLEGHLDTGGDTRVNLLASHPHSDEDVACAEYLRDRLLELGEVDEAAIVERMRTSSSAQKFYSEAFDRRDLELATGEPFGSFVMLARPGDPPTLERSVLNSPAPEEP